MLMGRATKRRSPTRKKVGITQAPTDKEEKPNAAGETEEDEHAGSAGRQFGKQAHGKNKKKSQ
jgi:hypothetical protein